MPSTDILTAADIEEFRFLIKDLAWPDSYEVLRSTTGGENEYGPIAGSEAVIEVGLCVLSASGLTPREQATADRLGWQVAYSVEMPFTTLLAPSDRLRIGNRTFEVGGVSREENWGLLAIAVVQEVG
jgi:hypothetical protein